VFVFEDIAAVMPITLPPGPSEGSETVLGWAPVVPLAVVPSVPDLLSWRPLPDNLGWWCFLTPVAHFHVASVSLDEAETFGLSGENVSVLFIDLGLGSSIVFLVGVLDCFAVFILLSLEQRALINGVHVFAFGLHFGIFLKKGLIDEVVGC